jgi:hypothetical protein
MSSEAEESLYAVLISLVVAAFGALLTHSTVCTEQAECVRHGTCYALTDDPYFCSFKTSVSPAGLRMLNHSAHQGGMVELNQGVCAPGMRQNVDAEGTLRCLRALSFPAALSEEIAYAGVDDDRPGAPDHERWCGRWIEAGSIAYGVERWAFFDERATEAAVDDLIVAKGSGRLAVSDVSKFRTACRTMVVSNSAGAAATLAYRELAPSLIATTLDKALETIGFLAGHYCDAPALLGIGTHADAFTARVMPGRPPTPGALANALYAVGESRATRGLAERFAQAMDGFELATLDAVTEAHSRALVAGSHAGTYVDALVGPNFKTGYEELNAPLARFVKAYGAEAAEGGGPEGAAAYLHGLAANCALAARAVVADEEGGLFFGKGRKGDDDAGAGAAPHAAALGRLHTDEADRFAPAGARTIANASTLALSSLRASSSVATATRSNARAVCLAAAKRVFPDAFDHLTFEALVTPRLYDRLQIETEAIREAVAVTLSEELVGNVFADYADRTAAVAKARAARVRIAGAPRGSWGGVARAFERPALRAEDGALTMLLKQARAVFLDRLVPVVTQADLCEHPPLYSGARRNAYLLLTGSAACVMLLPGLLVPPFADERYDQPSLYARAGFVIAHEFAHVTAYTQQWNGAYAERLLADYPASTHVEAIADVTAITALARFRFLTNESLCAATSQLFCARVGWVDGGGYPARPSHPISNDRGDAACQFTRKYLGAL